MAYAPFGSTDDLKRDLVAALLERTCLTQPLPADREAFEARAAEATLAHPVAQAACTNGAGEPVGGNSVRLLLHGEEAFAEFERQILAARHTIHIATFILGRDPTGRRIVQLLARRAREGVKVRLQLDALGCLFSSRRFVDPVRRAGAERAAINAPFQGGAAEIIKRAMVRLPRALRDAGLKARMLLQEHDELVFEEANVISDEARAMYNVAVKKDYRMQYGVLTFWSPNINIFRDPRWGRGQETYGEDPVLTTKMGIAFVKGLQGNDPTYLKVAACAKHYAVHSGPEKTRHEFNAEASMKDLWETYLPAFKGLVENNVEAVMCAYNKTNEVWETDAFVLELLPITIRIWFDNGSW
jgi:hypothetical protein